MTTSETILQQLAASQATTEAIADTLKQPAIVISAFCVDLVTAGLATSHALGNPDKGRKLITWRITEKGKTRAAELTAPAEDPQLALA